MNVNESNRCPVAVVTGAAQGMGRAFAMRLAEERFAIAAIDISTEKLRDTCKLIEQEGSTSKAYQADLTEISQIDPLFGAIEKDFGPIHVLVNNAGIMKVQPLLEVTEQDWDRIMTVNAKATFFCLKAAGLRMIQRKRGSIINIASVAARSARPTQTMYGASKAAVLHLTKSAAAALGPMGVRVNAICPGVIEAPMWHQVKSQKTPQEVETILHSIPLCRSATPREVADMVAFLASDHSGYITGQAINVCGGTEMD